MEKTKLLGARLNKDQGGVDFRVWAPNVKELSLVLSPDSGDARELPMEAEGSYFSIHVADGKAGTRYKYKLDGGDVLPDPVSRYQPLGPLGPSEVVDTAFAWKMESFPGIGLKEMVLYELHIGTFTKEGTFDSAIAELDRLKDLGVNALEVLPVSQFSGERNWGYDGVYPHAVQNSYGGPEAFKRFIDACHSRGMGVVLDVVYNHLGPEGNFLPRYFPVFQDKYHTPWGQAINFDGPHSDGVKAYFLQTVSQWLEEYKVDGLRLDAIQTILDTSPYPFLEQLTDLKREIENQSGRQIQVIGETDMNDPKVVRPPEQGGLGLDGHWNDDFHHCLHGLLSQERQGYFSDYEGLRDLERLYKRRVAYSGRFSVYRNRSHGRSYEGITPERLMVCSHNHDQIGNRALGDRKTTYLDFEALKLAGSAVLLSPFLPMLFMGEEYGETAPFQYFVSHESAELNELVRQGRRREFKEFNWQGEIPDPVSPETFNRSKLNTSMGQSAKGQALTRLYQRLIELSKQIRQGAWLDPDKVQVRLQEDQGVIELQGQEGFILQFNFSKTDASMAGAKEVAELYVDSSLYQTGSNGIDVKPRTAELSSNSYVLKAHSALAFRGQI